MGAVSVVVSPMAALLEGWSPAETAGAGFFVRAGPLRGVVRAGVLGMALSFKVT
jgi:hypothetical protein